jgi:hypothetical protein
VLVTHTDRHCCLCIIERGVSLGQGRRIIAPTLHVEGRLGEGRRPPAAEDKNGIQTRQEGVTDLGGRLQDDAGRRVLVQRLLQKGMQGRTAPQGHKHDDYQDEQQQPPRDKARREGTANDPSPCRDHWRS